jgi:hypothetical protein
MKRESSTAAGLAGKYYSLGAQEDKTARTYWRYRGEI